VNANTTADQVLSAIVQGAPDLTEAQIEAGGFSFLGTANMNVSTSGIGIANNNLEGNGTAGINSGDESFVINPETLLTAVKVFIDNSLQGYNPATEELYYRVFFEDGTSSAQTKVLAADLASEAGGQKSFLVQWDDVKMIDAVQLSMGLGAIKVPVIQFIKQVENMANDVQLAFNATLTDKDGDTASSTFEAKLFANDPNDQLFDYRLAGTIGEQDAFNIDLSAAENLYRVNGFDVGPDKLMLIGDPPDERVSRKRKLAHRNPALEALNCRGRHAHRRLDVEPTPESVRSGSTPPWLPDHSLHEAPENRRISRGFVFFAAGPRQASRSVDRDSAFQAATSLSTRLCLSAMRCTASLPRARRCGGLAAFASVRMAPANLLGSPGWAWLAPSAKRRMAPTVTS
jgi:hypothetical protein